MKQIIPNNIWEDLGTDYSIPIRMNSATCQAWGDNHLTSLTVPIASDYSNMRIIGDVDGAIWTLYKNDVATSITATSSGGVAQDTTHTVACVLNDRLVFRRQGTIWLYWANTPINTNLESDTATDFLQWYGFAPSTGPAAGGSLGSYGPSGNAPGCNTVSISPIAGNITRNLIIGWFITADAGKSYRATIWKNGIAQDGSGGTVDTRCAVSAAVDGWNFGTSTFTLPIAVGDRLETQIEAVVAYTNAFSLGNSVAVESTTAHEFAICGSNQVGSGAGGPYADTDVYGSVPGRWATAEGDIIFGAYNTGSISSFTLTRLQWYYTSLYPAGTGPVVFKLRKNGADPANQPTITVVTNDTYVQDANASHIVQIDSGDTWSLNAQPAAFGAVQAHWSFAGSANLAVDGSITVNKVTVPSSDTTDFDFTADGGLAPGSFTLAHGESQAFTPVTPGSGYSIVEDANINFHTTYEVSNGSPNTNIIVGSGEAVVVTVTNSMITAGGIYRLVPLKRNDTLYESFVPEILQDFPIP